MKNLKIFAKTIDEKAQSQIDTLMEQKAFAECKVRIMPDVHAGAGCVIGFTADLGEKVIPNIVGVDIGCGMLTASIGSGNLDFSKLDKIIHEKVPAGMTAHNEPVSSFPFAELRCWKDMKNKDWIERSLGTLGGGNHFIEVDVSCNGEKYLVIHTGSRNLGKQVAEYYQSLAIQRFYSKVQDSKELIARLKSEGRAREISNVLKQLKTSNKDAPPKTLCYLEGKERDDYLHDMWWCQLYARKNRNIIADIICANMSIDIRNSFETVHNYIDGNNMVRKGAVSAQLGEKLLIPINMRDGCIVGEGLGNEDWNCSAPHGAGRIMSRTIAKKEIQLEEYKKSMDGVYTSSVDMDTLDEAPQAYKPIEEILECIKDTVRVLEIIKPVYNFKASESLSL